MLCQLSVVLVLSEKYSPSIKFPIQIKSILDRKSSKTINNRKIIVLNQMGQLKHRIGIFFGRTTKKNSKIIW